MVLLKDGIDILSRHGLSLMSHASMPKSYWTYAFGSAVYLINRMPTSNLNFNNPFISLYKSPPNFEKLRVFGCLCFPWLKPYSAHKLDDKSTPCVFLGYSPSQSVYFYLDRSTTRIYTSRHVVFHETIFPFAISSPLTMTGNSSVTEEISFIGPSVTIIPQRRSYSLQTPPASQPVQESSPEISEPTTSPTASTPIPPTSASSQQRDQPAPISQTAPLAPAAQPVQIGPLSQHTAPPASTAQPDQPVQIAPLAQQTAPSATTAQPDQPVQISPLAQQTAPSATTAQPVQTQPPLRTSNRLRKPVQKLNLHT